MKRFSTKKVETYKRDKFTLNISKKGRSIVLNEKTLSSLKNCTFKPVSNATNLFDKSNKRLFIKASSSFLDSYQISDYFKQRRIISNIPEIYATLSLKNGKTYVISKNITDSKEVSVLFKKLKSENEKNSIKKEIISIGEKLLKENLVPWDLKVRQFFYSPSSKKLFFSDNTVAFSNPKLLLSYFKKANLKAPSSLKKLALLYSMHPFEILMSGVRSVRGNLNRKQLLPSGPLQEKATYVKTKGREVLENNFKKIVVNTIDFYNSLPFETKQKIQSEIIKELRASLERY